MRQKKSVEFYSEADQFTDNQAFVESFSKYFEEIKDPRVGMITLTGVEVDRDYAHAKVFYTTLGSKEDNFLVEKGLDHAKGFLRSSLSHRMKLRTIPQLQFVYDESVERGVRLSNLIDEAIAQEK